MITIIAGGRSLSMTPQEIENEMSGRGFKFEDITEIVSGGAPGIDACGEVFAEHFRFPIRKFPADWQKYGRRAGPIRNKQMAEYADILVLIWDGKSKGSASMKAEMKKLNKPILEIIIRPRQIPERREWRVQPSPRRETGTREMTLDFDL